MFFGILSKVSFCWVVWLQSDFFKQIKLEFQEKQIKGFC